MSIYTNRKYSVKLIANAIGVMSIILLFPCFLLSQTPTPQSVFFNTIKAMDNVQNARYHLDMTERIHDEYQRNHYLIKMQVKPYKVYSLSYTTNKGAEALYVQGDNNDEVLVNPNRMPWFNLNLDKYSMLIRKGHQFTIMQTGFVYINSTLQNYYRRDTKKFLNLISLLNDTTCDNKSCYRLQIDFAEFKWISYIPKQNETFSTIAAKYVLNDYMIMERNGKNSFNDVTPNHPIIIPNAFARKIVLTIDKKTMLPIEQIIYDDKGLCSYIIFKSLAVNVPFAHDEFTKNFKGYGF